MKSLLILSFSRLEQDARVRRQVDLFASRYRVTSAAYGPSVPGTADHVMLQVPRFSGPARKIRFFIEAALLRLRWYRVLYWSDPAVRAARGRLRQSSFDGIIANDIEAVPLAMSLAPRSRVHADLHEFYPGLHDDNPRWVRLRKPYFEWLIRTYATKAASTTTVGQGVAEAYSAFDLDLQIVTNAPSYRDLAPSPVHSPLRLVHAGGAMPGRRIERMMRAAAATSTDLVLTLYLTSSSPEYLRQLNRLASELGERVRVLPAVPSTELLEHLNGHDVGIHILPPTVTNQALALPNKFFDFVQARLGVIVGPSPGMASLVDTYKFGGVTEGFETDEIVRTLDALSPAEIEQWKSTAAQAASDLSAERQTPVWSTAIEALFADEDTPP